MNNLCKSISALAGVIVLAFSVYFYNERHDARAEDMKLVELRLEQKIQNDVLDNLQDRYWKLHDRCSKGVCTEYEWEQLRDLKVAVEEQTKKVAEVSKLVPVVFSPNMSIGVNMLFRVLPEIARILGPDYSVEIVEAHHKMKKDAPSGTAKKLAQVVTQQLRVQERRTRVGREAV